MKKRTLRKLAVALPLTVAGVIGVACAVQEYQGGSAFQPLASDRALQSNQVLFPDDGETTGKQPGSEKDNSALWEKDRAAEDTGRPQQQDRADYLFQNNTPTGGLSAALSGDNTPLGGPSDPTEVPGSVFDVVGDKNNADLILGRGDLPGGTGETNGTPAPVPPESNPPGGNTPSTPSGDNGSHGGTVTPTPTPIPTPTPTPTPTPKPDQDNSGGGNSGTATPAPAPTPVDPNEPVPGYGSASKDPDATTNEPTYGTTYKFEEASDTTLDNGVIRIEQPYNVNWTGGSGLYKGQKDVDELTVFKALVAYVLVENGPDAEPKNYVWGEEDLGKFIRIDGVSFDTGARFSAGNESAETDFPIDIPKTVDTLTIYISCRKRVTDPWESYTTTQVEDPPWSDTLETVTTPGLPYTLYESRTMVLREKLQGLGEIIDPLTILNQYEQYQDAFSDRYLNLFAYQKNLLGDTGTELTELFPGWKEDGVLVPGYYAYSTGRHVLEPAARVELDEDYQVQMQPFYLNEDYSLASYSAYGQSFLQTLVYDRNLEDRTYDYDTGAYHYDRIVVPNYVQAVKFLFSAESVDYLELPETVLYADTSGIQGEFYFTFGLEVKKGYLVDENNPRYTASGGLLYNKDRTELLGVPVDTTELTVGSDLSKVVLPSGTKLERLVLQFDDVNKRPAINYEKLKRTCKIVVPEKQLNAFIAQEKDVLNRYHLTVTTENKPEQSYTTRDGFVLSQDGVLHEVLRKDVDWLELPDFIRGVEPGALHDLTDMTVLILPKNGQELALTEAALAAPALTTVACYTDAQLAQTKAAVGAETSLTVKKVDVVREDGYAYLSTKRGWLLLSAPDTLTEFDGTIPMPDGAEALPVAAVGDQAFQDHDQLRWVNLNEATQGIGYQAFQGCASLEGVVINTREIVLLSEDAFANCPRLRFVASNAATCRLKDPDFVLHPDGTENYSFLYAPTNGEGYNGNWSSFSVESDVADYDLVDCQGTKVLYGRDSSGQHYLALRSGETITDTVTLDTGTTQIFWYAFQKAREVNDGVFDLNWAALPELFSLGDYAFDNSDLGGDITIPSSQNEYYSQIQLGTAAFKDCKKLKRITVTGPNITASENIFMGCENLTEATLGDFNVYSGLLPDTFYRCNALKTLTFTGETPPALLLYGSGYGFRFNSDGETTEEGRETLRIQVPQGREQAYINAWRYQMAGARSGMDSAYQNMRETYRKQDYNNRYSEAIEQALDERIKQALTAAENQLRGMLGLEGTVDEPTNFYQYNFEENWDITLRAVPSGSQALDLTYFDWWQTDREDIGLLDGEEPNRIQKGAFANSPGLESVRMPYSLKELEDGAFTGVTSGSLTLTFTEGTGLPALTGYQTGVPFDFGVNDAAVHLEFLGRNDVRLLAGEDGEETGTPVYDGGTDSEEKPTEPEEPNEPSGDEQVPPAEDNEEEPSEPAGPDAPNDPDEDEQTPPAEDNKEEPSEPAEPDEPSGDEQTPPAEDNEETPSEPEAPPADHDGQDEFQEPSDTADETPVKTLTFGERCIAAWAYPMAGYRDYEEMHRLIEDQETLIRKLMEGENRLRRMAGLDEITQAQDMLSLPETLKQAISER